VTQTRNLFSRLKGRVCAATQCWCGSTNDFAHPELSGVGIRQPHVLSVGVRFLLFSTRNRFRRELKRKWMSQRHRVRCRETPVQRRGHWSQPFSCCTKYQEMSYADSGKMLREVFKDFEVGIVGSWSFATACIPVRTRRLGSVTPAVSRTMTEARAIGGMHLKAQREPWPMRITKGRDCWGPNCLPVAVEPPVPVELPGAAVFSTADTKAS